MSEIRNFFYLDEYKMYSISSQIFEGITEYLTDYRTSSTEESEKQSGPIGSGRVMANILRSESASHERKFLHDHSYALLEQHLEGEDKILSVTKDNINDIVESIDEAAFVAVKAKTVFNDMKLIMSMFDSFNQIGEALTYLSHGAAIEQAHQDLLASRNPKGDRNTQARARQQQQTLEASLLAAAKNADLHLDPTLLVHLKFLLQYGFQDQFEVRMLTGDYTFSANLKREYIRENEQLFVKKYSRFSEKEFVLFGTVAQGLNIGDNESIADDESHEEFQGAGTTHLKEVIMGMVEALSNVESTYSGRLTNEIIIDPIAIYREI